MDQAGARKEAARRVMTHPLIKIHRLHIEPPRFIIPFGTARSRDPWLPWCALSALPPLPALFSVVREMVIALAMHRTVAIAQPMSFGICIVSWWNEPTNTGRRKDAMTIQTIH